jgi:hypothetical protein
MPAYQLTTMAGQVNGQKMTKVPRKAWDAGTAITDPSHDVSRLDGLEYAVVKQRSRAAIGLIPAIGEGLQVCRAARFFLVIIQG